jgi:transcriptional regulator with XRE-family HTH domain
MDEQQQQVRRRRTREEAERLAAEYEASGLTRQQFSNRSGVSMKMLARYASALARNNPPPLSKTDPLNL